MRNIRDYFLLTLKGMAMGAADVIPGVSGGTIAFITGIYEELINSIKSINGNALKLLFAGKFVELWKSVNGNFLLSVLIGIGISIPSLAKGLEYLLNHHPIWVWSFFFGLILASTIYVARTDKKWNSYNCCRYCRNSHSLFYHRYFTSRSKYFVLVYSCFRSNNHSCNDTARYFG